MNIIGERKYRTEEKKKALLAGLTYILIVIVGIALWFVMSI